MEIALGTNMLMSNITITKQCKQPIQLVGKLLPVQQQGIHLEYRPSRH